MGVFPNENAAEPPPADRTQISCNDVAARCRSSDVEIPREILNAIGW